MTPWTATDDIVSHISNWSRPMEDVQLSIAVAEWSSVGSDTFQFWMAATFAVVIASHAAGRRLVKWARVSIAILYATATVSFVARMLSMIERITDIVISHPEVPLRPLGADAIATISVAVVMLCGSVLAIVMVLRPTIATVSETS